MKQFEAHKAFSQEYRQSEEYKAYMEGIRRVAPELPQMLAEQAIFMHKKNPRLYRVIEEEERKEARRQKSEASSKSTRCRQQAGPIVTTTTEST